MKDSISICRLWKPTVPLWDWGGKQSHVLYTHWHCETGYFSFCSDPYSKHAPSSLCAHCTALQAGDSAGVVPFHYITLHKARQRKLISPHLYSQRLKIHILKVSKWLLSLKGQRWSTAHNNGAHWSWITCARLSAVSNREGGVDNTVLHVDSVSPFSVSPYNQCFVLGSYDNHIYSK